MSHRDHRDVLGLTPRSDLGRSQLRETAGGGYRYISDSGSIDKLGTATHFRRL
jgi:hypothetical protein